MSTNPSIPSTAPRTTPPTTLTPVITQCCIEALYRMGKEFQPVVDMAKRAERRKCNHREAVPPQDCLKDMVGELPWARGEGRDGGGPEGRGTPPFQRFDDRSVLQTGLSWNDEYAPPLPAQPFLNPKNTG